MSKTISAIIVLYNVSYEKSVTFNALKGYKDINIIICDNSTIALENQDVVKQYPNVTYLSMNGNAGLSKAYNKAIDFLSEKGIEGYICLFDDDTSVGADYFDALNQAISQSNADVYLPAVYDEIGLLSPCNQEGVKSIRVSSISELNKKNMTGINSGMAINLGVFKNYRYDEGYFLDYIDHAFLRDMKKQNKRIEVFFAELHQRFSANDFVDVKGARVRFKLFYKDFYRFCDYNMSDRFYAIVTIIKRWGVINCRMPLLRVYKKYVKHEKID